MLIAIYSRKSRWSARGESVENQVRMCMEYISANIPGGAEAKILVYEDEGFSGKNTKRPRFQQMMEDMRKNHFQSSGPAGEKHCGPGAADRQIEPGKYGIYQYPGKI